MKPQRRWQSHIFMLYLASLLLSFSQRCNFHANANTERRVHVSWLCCPELKCALVKRKAGIYNHAASFLHPRSNGWLICASVLRWATLISPPLYLYIWLCSVNCSSISSLHFEWSCFCLSGRVHNPQASDVQ